MDAAEANRGRIQKENAKRPAAHAGSLRVSNKTYLSRPITDHSSAEQRASCFTRGQFTGIPTTKRDMVPLTPIVACVGWAGQDSIHVGEGKS
jgi:hypothetical protein